MENNLKERRKELGLTLEEVGKLCGVTKSTVRKWENGIIENMKRDKIALLANALKTTPLFIMGDSDKLLYENTIPVDNFQKIEIIGSVKAGACNVAQYEHLGYEYAANVKNTDDYRYFKVNGDSMLPDIKENDLALVRLQNDIESGELAVVIINGEEGVIKKVIKGENSTTLFSFNSNYEPRIFAGKEQNILTIYGKVVKIERSY